MSLPIRYQHHLRVVSDRYGIPAERVAAIGQKQRIQLAARSEWIWRLCIVEQIGFNPVAHRLGCDHTTLMNLCQGYSREMFGSPPRARLNTLIETALRSVGHGELEKMRFKPTREALSKLELAA